MPEPKQNAGDDDPIRYGVEETYGGEGYVWPYKAPPRQWDHTLMGYPPGPGRPKGTGRRLQDLTGGTFGELTVLERIGDRVTPAGTKQPRYRVRCSCGVEKDVLGTNLRNGRTSSCGHLATGKPNRKYNYGDLGAPSDYGTGRLIEEHRQRQRRQNGL